MATTFITTHNADLVKGKMPADFLVQFAGSRAAYDKAFENYSLSKDNISKGGTAKQDANNEVHAALMQMLADGKAIYRKNPAMKKFFTYSELVKMITGPGKTGIRFKLEEEISLLPVSTTTITAQPGNHTLYADKKGIAMKLMPAGKYTFVATTPGMKTVTQSIKINTGSVRHIKLELKKAVEIITDKPLNLTATNQQLPAEKTGG